MIAERLQQVPIAINVERVLRHLRLAGSVMITGLGPEARYVQMVPLDFRLAEHVLLDGWPRDSGPGSKRFHPGCRSSFREPHGVSPNLQLYVFEDTAKPRSGQHPAHWVGADLDMTAPNIMQPAKSIWHGVMVAWHKISGRTTDQAAIARALDRRFRNER